MAVRRTLNVELHKIATMRMAFAMGAAGLLLVAMFTLVTLVASGSTPRDGLPGLGDGQGQRMLLSGGAFAAITLVVLGVLVTAGEYRHRTIIASLLIEPRRARLLWAKVAIVAALGGLVGAAAAAIAIGGGLAGLRARDLAVELSAGEIVAIAAGTACYVALLAVIGCAVGALLPEQITAVATTLGILWILDPLVSQLVPAIERLGPGGLGKSLTGAPVDGGLGAPAAALALAAAALLLVMAAIRRQQGDVAV
jgi:hypothetical protein